MFKWTQSALKDFERPEVCPRKWKAKWLDKEIKSEPTEAMIKGKYFEYLAIGGGANSNEEATDLPRLSSGKKSVDQIRIEEQAEKCKELFNPKSDEFIGIEIISTQEVLSNATQKGTADIIGINSSTGKSAMPDIKLTANVESTYGEFSWGNSSKLDYTQQIHYRNLFVEKYKEEPEMSLLVFDYSPKKNVKLIELDITDAAIDAVKERFAIAEEIKTMSDEVQWEIYDPSESECSSCPLKCHNRFTAPIVVKERITI